MTYPEGINTFATFVSLEAVVYLKEHARGRAGECCIFPQSHAWVKFVRKIFLSGMAILTLIIMLFLIICKYITTGHSSRRHRQEQNQQLPRSLVNTLPGFVFSSAFRTIKMGKLSKSFPAHTASFVSSWS